MKKMVIVIVKITGVIAAISVVAGIIAFIKERIDEKKERSFIDEKTGNVQKHVPGFYERYIKRSLDCMLATGALIVLSPVLLVTAVLVRIKLGSPVIFTQNRPGWHEKIFRLIKFRTMDNRRGSDGELLPDEVRLNSYGRFLRTTSLDELPELFNILTGDMSIIGPRPLLVEYIPRYDKFQHRRHDVRPGLTGYAQVHGRNAISWDEKFKMDVWYTKNVSFKTDVKIFFDTIKTVLKHEGISSETSATMEKFMGNAVKND